MPTSSRVPQADDKFNDFITGTGDYLLVMPGGGGTPAHWERLGLTAAQNTTWQDHKADWITKFAAVKANKLNGIQDKNATKAKNDVKVDFTDFVTKPGANLLELISNSPNATDNDRTVFNIKLRDDIRTTRPQIITAPFVDFKAEEGGIILVTCRVASDSTRASMNENADNIEMKYAITDVGATPPATAADCPGTFTTTKAISRFNGAASMPGKRIHAFLRWQNDTDKAKSGPYNQRVTVVIGD